MTKEQIITLSHGTVLEHTQLTNADGSPLRARVNGKPQLWKRSPNKFKLPMKHGLRQCFYITETNSSEWRLPGATL